jgi:undecaprenyl-diphosphatase
LIHASGYAFPSGHATAATLFAFLVVWMAARHLRRRQLHLPIAATMIVWASCVCLSRLVLGVHYLTDVVGGIGLGLMIGGVVFAGPIVARAVRDRLAHSHPTPTLGAGARRGPGPEDPQQDAPLRKHQ